MKPDDNSDGKSSYGSLEKFLYATMPTADQFEIDETVSEMKLVGIGGTVRAIHKFMLGIFQRPLSLPYGHATMTKKMVNLSNDIFKILSQDELMRIKSIDKQRSKTITAGSYVIKILMDRLGFDELLVCPTGLREGILENYLYFTMDKKHRLRKKFIGLNYDYAYSIVYSDSLDRFSKGNAKSSPFVLFGSQGENFPKKIISTKLDKIKE
jgi:exopolyphosphatase/guanosine-5'-triphosphate,3'-diphosphate pyrophosphatase